jgi:hypothetical protein
MHIVLIATSGNQKYIFATNKLRENVGASELTYRIGTETVLKAVAEETRDKVRLFEEHDLSGCQLRANLLDSEKNPELKPGGKVEVITATSGKALLFVENIEIARSIVQRVTEYAVREMPGLTVSGAISEDFGDLAATELKGIHEAIISVHQKADQIRHRIPSVTQRFLRMPFSAPCSTSGLPAKATDKEGGSEILVSAMSKAKRDNFHPGHQRLAAAVHAASSEISFIKNVDELERRFKELAWVAVIHADGNGVGQIFQRFDKYTGLKSGCCSPRDYIKAYREFSIALDVCTINAFSHALEVLQFQLRNENKQNSTKEIPVVPLILGGDDLTLLCDGQFALKFVYEYLRKFEDEASNLSARDYLSYAVGNKTVHECLKGVIPKIATAAFGVPRLGISAGVAIIKAHFPFHQAYELSEQLLRTAKVVKTEIRIPASSFDFHILYDSAHTDLNYIRDNRMKVAYEETYLFAKPYVVTENDRLSHSVNTWLRYRKFEELERRVRAIVQRDTSDATRRVLSNNKMHEIRQSLLRGKEVADAEAGLIRNRLSQDGQREFDNLLVTKDSLFFDDSKKKYTHFLDAIEAVEFWKGFQPTNESNESEASQ